MSLGYFSGNRERNEANSEGRTQENAPAVSEIARSKAIRACRFKRGAIRDFGMEVKIIWVFPSTSGPVNEILAGSFPFRPSLKGVGLAPGCGNYPFGSDGDAGTSSNF